jgi:hypothetical protein
MVLEHRSAIVLFENSMDIAAEGILRVHTRAPLLQHIRKDSTLPIQQDNTPAHAPP